MPKLRLVIDASVAGRAGETGNPGSKANRKFLLGARKHCHRIVMTPQIRNEWKAHQSRFSKIWYGSMRRKRKVEDKRHQPDQELRGAIEASERGREAMRKDAPLVEMAWVADLTVVSTDERARALFAGLSPKLERLRQILWVNPERDSESVLRWLRRGVNPLSHWRLAAQRVD